MQVQIGRANDIGWDDGIARKLCSIIEGHSEMLPAASEMGVKIIAGSDAGSCIVPHGKELVRELEFMQATGMSTLDVLAVVPAQVPRC